jgi:acetyltransferase-like isoleucine patch superfamily enzyme
MDFQNMRKQITIIRRLFISKNNEDLSSWNTYKANIIIGKSVILANASSLSLSGNPKEYGYCVQIGANSQVFGHLVLQKPGATIKIGERSQIGSSHLIASTGIEIGDDVLVAWGVTIMDNDSHSLDWKLRGSDVTQFGIDYCNNSNNPTENKNWDVVKMKKVVISSRVWIGFGVSILKGVLIGEGAIIGAGSVVTNDIPAYSLAAGNPARVIRKLPDYSHG